MKVYGQSEILINLYQHLNVNCSFLINNAKRFKVIQHHCS